MKAKKFITLILCVGITFGVGLFSSALTGNMQPPYLALSRPPLAPPAWLFGIVWPVLYILTGIALYLVIAHEETRLTQRWAATGLYALQLVVNFLWPIVFFRFGMLWAAFAVILLLDALVIATIMVFRRISWPAALLMVPYLCWLLFATYLNVGCAILN